MLSSQLSAIVAVVMVAGALFLGTVPVREDGLVIAVKNVKYQFVCDSPTFSCKGSSMQ